MTRWRLALMALGLLLIGCTRVIDAGEPRRAAPVGPVSALQVGDLLSPKIQDKDGNIFIKVEPEGCSGVAREKDPPFIFDHDPAATDGGHWTAEGGREVLIEEMVGVFPASFDPAKALAAARRTIESCREVPLKVNTMRHQYAFTLMPQIDSGTSEIVLWSFAGADWGCDSAFVAAHNAAVEISTCGPITGYDVLSLAQDALKRIDALANTKA
jgi:hypothetical protein